MSEKLIDPEDPRDFTDICTNSSHKAVHYDELGYMKCDLDKKYVFADGRTITFSNPEDRALYVQALDRLTAVYGFARNREEE